MCKLTKETASTFLEVLQQIPFRYVGVHVAVCTGTGKQSCLLEADELTGQLY
jgi:hypothetical protein